MSSITETTEERVSKLQDRSIQIIQSEQYREKQLKEMNTALGTCGRITKDLITFMSLESQKRRKYRAEEIFDEIM